MKNYNQILILILLYQVPLSAGNPIKIANKAKEAMQKEAVMYAQSSKMSALEEALHEKVIENKRAFDGLGVGNLKQKKPEIKKAQKSLLAVFQEADPIEREALSELEQLLLELNIDKQVQMLEKLKKAIEKLHPETKAFILSLISPLTKFALGL